MTKRQSRGFTFIEILVVLAVMLIILFVSVSAFSQLGSNSARKLAVQDVITTFTSARTNTLSSQGNTVFGVHIDDDAVIRFTGSTYSSTSPTNKSISFERGMTATSSLSGGVTDIVFARLTGEPSATGTITLTEPATGASTTVTIYQSGLIE